MNRRDMLRSIAAASLAAAATKLPNAFGAHHTKKSKLGIAKFSYAIRTNAQRDGKSKGDLSDPINYLEHCHQIGAGGIQTSLGIRDDSYIRKLRQTAEKYQMYIEGSASLPRDTSDVERFEQTVLTAKKAGANVIRLAIGQRRYEQFDKLEQFKAFARRTWDSVQLAEPIVARHHMRLAIENHKDFRTEERFMMFNRLDSEYIGVCVDIGNCFALLQEPMAFVKENAPYAFAVHLKDIAVAPYEDGFLLADVVLGQGLLDLKQIVALLQKANPNIRFSLEMSTRDPLKVPCLTENYWATLTNVPGIDLVRALAYVRKHATPDNLPKINHLSLTEKINLEESNIKKCLAYAKNHLNL